LFEPFLEWVNGKLAKSPWIGIGGGIQEGMTYADLLTLIPVKHDTASLSTCKYKIIVNPMYSMETGGCKS